MKDGRLAKGMCVKWEEKSYFKRTRHGRYAGQFRSGRHCVAWLDRNDWIVVILDDDTQLETMALDSLPPGPAWVYQ